MNTKIAWMLLAATIMLAGGNAARADIVTRSIQLEEDDAEEYLNTNDPSGGTYPDYLQRGGWVKNSDLELGSEGEEGLAWQVIAVQYNQLGIPQGATITSAKLTFTIDGSGNPGTSDDFTIIAEAADMIL